MYSPSSPSRRRRWILRESETQHEYCTNSVDSLTLYCQRPGGGMADAEDLKSSGDFSSCGFDSHPGHQCFRLKMNQLMRRGLACTSSVPRVWAIRNVNGVHIFHDF